MYHKKPVTMDYTNEYFRMLEEKKKLIKRQKDIMTQNALLEAELSEINIKINEVDQTLELLSKRLF